MCSIYEYYYRIELHFSNFSNFKWLLFKNHERNSQTKIISWEIVVNIQHELCICMWFFAEWKCMLTFDKCIYIHIMIINVEEWFNEWTKTTSMLNPINIKKDKMCKKQKFSILGTRNFQFLLFVYCCWSINDSKLRLFKRKINCAFYM